MRTEQLEYLLETAHSSSISKAGEKLHITQQSLNAALKKLENELGATLLERNYAGIRLTEQGKVAAKYAEEILKKLDEMKQTITDYTENEGQDQLRDNLVLYASPAALHALIPRAVQLLMKQHPLVTTTLMERENRDMVRSIMQGEACAGITTVIDGLDRDFELMDRKKIFYQRLSEAKMYISVAEHHPLAQQKSVTAHTLLKYPLGIYQLNEHAPHVVVEWLRQKGEPKVHLKTNNLRVYQRAITAGEVIGFLPKVMCKQAIDVREGVLYLPVRDFPAFETVCVMDWAYYREHQAVIVALLEAIEVVLNE